MLVLSRKTDESVWIGSSIQVKVLEVQNGRVKLGFSAPPDVAVQREEIRDAMANGSKGRTRRVAARHLCGV